MSSTPYGYRGTLFGPLVEVPGKRDLCVDIYGGSFGSVG